MHDCPRCKVPLHGYEKVCPACGTPQYVSSAYEYDDNTFARPKNNSLPIIVVASLLLFGLCGYFVIQYTWVGQLIKGNKDEPKVLTTLESRNKIMETLDQDFKNINVQYKCKCLSQDKEVPLTTDQDINLSIEAKLANKSQKDGIVPSLKPFLQTAKISTIVIKDTKTQASWTYTITQDNLNNSSGESNESSN